MRKLHKKGQRVLIGIAIAVVVFIVVVAAIEPLKDLVIIARDDTHLNCTSTAISTGTKATCIIVDFWLFYFVTISIGMGLSFITGRRIVKASQ